MLRQDKSFDRDIEDFAKLLVLQITSFQDFASGFEQLPRDGDLDLPFRVRRSALTGPSATRWCGAA